MSFRVIKTFIEVWRCKRVLLRIISYKDKHNIKKNYYLTRQTRSNKTLTINLFIKGIFPNKTSHSVILLFLSFIFEICQKIQDNKQIICNYISCHIM